VNWKRILAFAALLFASGVLVGFIEGGYTGTDMTALRQQLALGVCLSFGLSVAIFSAMSFRQDYRPFLHALSAGLLLKAFSLVLAAAFPATLGETPVELVVLGWITLGLALVTGTALGRYMAGLRRKARADA
jgi:drug/metabolite transporter (DMT)-like permease